MTTKQKENLENFKNKLFWFIIPLLITFFTWITVMIYGIKTEVEVSKTEAKERKELQEKIYHKVETNYTLLQSKADEVSNRKEHEIIYGKLDNMNNKLNLIYKNEKYSYSYNETRKDTFFIPKMVLNNKLGTAKLNTNE